MKKYAYYGAEIAKIDKILEGRFSDPKDRAYWVNKRNELEIKDATYSNNLKYYKKNIKYNR
ncbi:MAG: hypothetical protein J6W33_01590 [Spirochaetia bacterium]|nr:hypothetical protein [Spirochaetia bacterium]